MSPIRHSFFDQLILQTDHALRTLTGAEQHNGRPSPAENIHNDTLTDNERQHAAGLMRVNHCGEVCAQALYQGQALTAKLPDVRNKMAEAAIEEIDHLEWCQERIDSLNSHTSILNPLWYSMSFAVGAGAGLISDKISLGFVAATEDQVCQHLEEHLKSLPDNDHQSRAVVETMLEDEARHATTALEAGGLDFPAPVKSAMTLVSKVMTKASYRI